MNCECGYHFVFVRILLDLYFCVCSVVIFMIHNSCPALLLLGQCRLTHCALSWYIKSDSCCRVAQSQQWGIAPDWKDERDQEERNRKRGLGGGYL